MYGWSLSLVKPITPYLGVGAMLEVGKDLSMCEDCVNYNFEELSEGVFLNLNIPLSTHFSLVSNFMFLVHWEEGTVEDLYWDRFVPIVVFDEKTNGRRPELPGVQRENHRRMGRGRLGMGQAGIP